MQNYCLYSLNYGINVAYSGTLTVHPDTKERKIGSPNMGS